jgi:hypothetical protein
VDVGDRGIAGVERGEERRAQAREQRRLGAVDESDGRAGDVVLKADDGLGGRVLVGERRSTDRRATCPADGAITRDGWRWSRLDDVPCTGPRLAQLNAYDGELRDGVVGVRCVGELDRTLERRLGADEPNVDDRGYTSGPALPPTTRAGGPAEAAVTATRPTAAAAAPRIFTKRIRQCSFRVPVLPCSNVRRKDGSKGYPALDG